MEIKINIEESLSAEELVVIKETLKKVKARKAQEILNNMKEELKKINALGLNVRARTDYVGNIENLRDNLYWK